MGKSVTGFDAEGDFKKILSGIDDVAESASKYLDEITCGIMLFDADYRITFVNEYNAGFTDLSNPSPNIPNTAQPFLLFYETFL